MTYKLHALTIWEQGHYRDNQEDAVFPALGKVTDDDRLFMVCDGMGGHEAGEVASNTVIEAMSRRILAESTPTGTFSDELFQQALSEAYDLLDERDPNPESMKRMGTTMTFLKFHEEGATVAHIGDSRIYQFRLVDGKMTIVFKSVDHSLVNDLVKVGEMTPEEARTSPLKNRLTRAMQSHLDNRPKADVRHLTDIRPGDYFYLCSDGMLENAEDANLCFMLGKNVPDEEKVAMLKGNSDDNHDNHSAVLVHVLETNGFPTLEAQEQSETTKEMRTQPQLPQKPQPEFQQSNGDVFQPHKKGNSVVKWVLITILVAVAGVMAFRYYQSTQTEGAGQQASETPVPPRIKPPQRPTPQEQPVAPAAPTATPADDAMGASDPAPASGQPFKAEAVQQAKPKPQVEEVQETVEKEEIKEAEGESDEHKKQEKQEAAKKVLNDPKPELSDTTHK